MHYSNLTKNYSIEITIRFEFASNLKFAIRTSPHLSISLQCISVVSQAKKEVHGVANKCTLKRGSVFCCAQILPTYTSKLRQCCN